jgi:hypothetical protein
MNSIKGFGFIMAVLFTTLGGLCIVAILFKDLKFPIPAILVVSGLIFFMGAAILLLLTVVLDCLQKPINKEGNDTLRIS